MRGKGLGIYGDGERDGVEVTDRDINQIRIDQAARRQELKKFLDSLTYSDQTYGYAELVSPLGTLDSRVRSHKAESLTFLEDQHHVFQFEKNNRTIISGCMYTKIGIVSVFAVNQRTHLNAYINERFYVRKFEGFLTIDQIFHVTHRFILDLKKIQHLKPEEMRQARKIIAEEDIEKTNATKKKRGRPRKNLSD